MIGPACRLAIDEYRRTSHNIRRFWNLIYAVAAASAVALIVFIVTLAVGSGLTAIVPGVGSVLGGVALTSLVKLKDDAYKEHRRARAAVKSDCGGATARGEESGTTSVEELLSALID